MKNILTKYNTANSLLIISSYPERGVRYSGKVCAVGGVAKNTVKSLQTSLKERKEKRPIIVLTVTTGKREMYVEDNVLVIRCFERNKILSYISIYKKLLQFNNVVDVLVEFEFASFGNAKTTGLFPLVLFLLRLLNKNTTLVLHQVLTNVSEIAGHIGMTKESPNTIVLNIFLKLFYRAITLFPQHIIVLEEVFKKRLEGLTNNNKITVIPHGVDQNMKKISRNVARKALGIKENEKILLYFGYLTWYKGADWLVKTIASQKKKTKNSKLKLVVAGGPSFTQKGKAHYDKYVNKIYKLAGKSKNITITGFVNEKDISLYFAACDLVVLPYRTMLSSSGPLSLTCSFGKPLLLSNHLKAYTYSRDFQEAMKESDLSINDLFFPLQEKSFLKKVQILSKGDIKKLQTFSTLLGQKRAFTNLSKAYYNLLSSVGFYSKLANSIITPVYLRIYARRHER
ncbi:MAG: glycosyltransferase [Candidatus Levybacteria bacterium]|nr:glycosyltransferase [Candidatus Levybacteria bacterium]